MLKPIRVIAGDIRKLYLTIAMNVIHLMLNGAPYGILFFVLNELFKPKDKINITKIIWMFSSMTLILVINILLAMKVHTKAYTKAYSLSSEARLTLGDHLRKLSMGFFKKRDPGDITSLLLQDMSKVEMVFSHFFIDAISCLIIPAIMAVIFLFANIKMTALMLTSVLIAVPSLMAAQKIISFYGKKHLKTRNRVASRVLEYLQGIKVLKAFNLTGNGFKRLDLTLKKFRDDSIKLEAAAAGPVILYIVILELGFIGLLLLGVHLLCQGGITIPVLLIFLVIGYKFFEPLINFGIFVSEMRYMNLAAERITDVMDTAPLSEPLNPLIPEKYDIEFCDVRFGYGDNEVLKGINAVFPEKSITALVGYSGSGKTTITNLIARFQDVDSGSVLMGGTDIRQIGIENLYFLISMVFQDVYLFQDTVYNNIRVGKKDASKEEIIAAAKTAQCHNFIEKFEKGYDTIVGEGGSTLSGGEKQRISIARAILKDAPVILLDEATASLDPENEILIQNAIAKLIKSKTLIIIAHRLSTIAKADNILVIDKGKVVEQGTHKKLLENGHVYSKLWDEQQQAKGWKFGSNRRLEMTA